MNLPDKYPEILVEMIEIMMPLLLLQTSVEQAEHLAYTIAEAFRKELGGMPIYLSKGQEFELSQRDLALWNDYTGRNIHELVKKYNVSAQWVYSVVKRARALDLKTRQGDLFGNDEG